MKIQNNEKRERIHNLCASQSSTSSTLAAPAGGGSLSSSSSCSSSIINGRGPAIDRYNPIIHDQSRLLVLNPHQFQNNGNANDDDDDACLKINKKKDKEEKKNWSIKGRRSWSCMCMNPGGFITPGGSSRFLLSQVEPRAADNKSKDDSSAPLPFQVVLLRVSLHCRGCEKKLRKHLSTMEGVSSYNIEFAAKKVTVEGNVTPLGLLSKVKNAQLWFPPAAPAPAPSPPQTISEINIASSSSVM